MIRNSRFRRFLGTCESGTSAIEFALVLPVLILMFLGAIELCRFAIIHQKLDKLSYAMADFVTQGSNVTKSDLVTFASTADQIMQPFNFSGTIIFTSVVYYNNSPPPPCTGTAVSCIAWQDKERGSAGSLVGSPGGNAVMPGGYGVLDNQNAIVSEVFYNFQPLVSATGNFIPSLKPQSIYKISVFKPRLAALTIIK